MGLPDRRRVAATLLALLALTSACGSDGDDTTSDARIRYLSPEQWPKSEFETPSPFDLTDPPDGFELVTATIGGSTVQRSDDSATLEAALLIAPVNWDERSLATTLRVSSFDHTEMSGGIGGAFPLADAKRKPIEVDLDGREALYLPPIGDGTGGDDTWPQVVVDAGKDPFADPAVAHSWAIRVTGPGATRALLEEVATAGAFDLVHRPVLNDLPDSTRVVSRMTVAQAQTATADLDDGDIDVPFGVLSLAYREKDGKAVIVAAAVPGSETHARAIAWIPVGSEGWVTQRVDVDGRAGWYGADGEEAVLATSMEDGTLLVFHARGAAAIDQETLVGAAERADRLTRAEWHARYKDV